ncbi:hypothetical protein VIGAN_08271700 [Vigna angularis var. angularis]|uniref:Pentacotripeptide-repeat region of PRORP domain-containing protein n=1 Tax=Vigna angularis var. angularis TaxID=157739 RepID=A0A0S3SSP8_PHAAN|nr:hypothetical protein VIGAN_08271700 [Vigna angularis var. angularis]
MKRFGDYNKGGIKNLFAEDQISSRGCEGDIANGSTHYEPDGGKLCPSSQNPMEAHHLFDEMRVKGLCVPNDYCYNCLFEALSKAGEVDLVEARLEEMRGESGCKKLIYGVFSSSMEFSA